MRSFGDVEWSDGLGKRWTFIRKHLGAIPAKINVPSPFTQPKLCEKNSTLRGLTKANHLGNIIIIVVRCHRRLHHHHHELSCSF
jgi:hypothetical protein